MNSRRAGAAVLVLVSGMIAVAAPGSAAPNGPPGTTLDGLEEVREKLSLDVPRPPTASAAGWDPDFAEAVTDLVAICGSSMTPTLAATRLDDSFDLSAIGEYLGRTAPDLVSGVAHDPCTGDADLFVTDLTAAAEALEPLDPARLAYVSMTEVAYSYAFLDQLEHGIDTGSDPRFPGTPAANINVEDNLLDVWVDPDHPVQPPGDPWLRVVGTTEDTVPTGELGGDACHDRDNCGVPLRSGVKIVRSDQAACSLGFTASATDGSRWAVTAGHCSHANVQWRHGEQSIGPMRYPDFREWIYDVGRIHIQSPYWLSGTKGWFYNAYNPSTPLPVDLAIASELSIKEGGMACLSGIRRTFTNACGTFRRYGSIQMWQVRDVDACSGDSGGGWYYRRSDGQRWAVGIHSQSLAPGKTPEHHQPADLLTCNEAGGTSYFTTVPDINRHWDDEAAATIRFDDR